MAPPRERGSALRLQPVRSVFVGSPARAGIGPDRSDEGVAAMRLPRASGDRPCAVHAPQSASTAPPRERGSAHDQGISGHETTGSPARAGIGPPSSTTTRSSTRLPRASGDRPITPAVDDKAILAPPRERGSARFRPSPPARRSGSPARAGIGPPLATRASPKARLPRASGDRPVMPATYGGGDDFFLPRATQSSSLGARVCVDRARSSVAPRFREGVNVAPLLPCVMRDARLSPASSGAPERRSRGGAHPARAARAVRAGS